MSGPVRLAPPQATFPAALFLALAACLPAAARAQRASPPSAPAAAKAAPAHPLRVCADPNNLPFSNRAGQGFENHIATLLARDLGARLVYAWHPEARGLVRKTLEAGLCDVLLGVPGGYDPVRTTRPYYRSSYVFVTRKGGPHVRSLDDPALRHLRIGVHVIGDDYNNTPPVAALAARGIISNIIPFRIVDDYREPDPPLRLLDAVADDSVDVAIVWGPFAGYAARHAAAPLALTPVRPARDRSGARFAFAMALGVRKHDAALAHRLDAVLAHEHDAIRRILERYGIPLLPVGPATAAAAAH